MAEMADDRWAIKRPRGTNPAIERGDLEAIAAVAAAVASAGRPGAAAARDPWTSRFRCAHARMYRLTRGAAHALVKHALSSCSRCSSAHIM